MKSLGPFFLQGLVLDSWDSTETSCGQPGWLSDFSELVAL